MLGHRLHHEDRLRVTTEPELREEGSPPASRTRPWRSSALLAPRRRLLRRIVLILLLSPGLQACGTILTFSDGLKETPSALSPKPFGGLRLDVRAVSMFANEESAWRLAVLVFALDLPLSLAADALTLPLTLPIHLISPEEPSPNSTQNN